MLLGIDHPQKQDQPGKLTDKYTYSAWIYMLLIQLSVGIVCLFAYTNLMRDVRLPWLQVQARILDTISPPPPTAGLSYFKSRFGDVSETGMPYERKKKKNEKRFVP